MTDYEIRYFHADGSLGLIRMTYQLTDETPESCARRAERDFARYEIRRGNRYRSLPNGCALVGSRRAGQIHVAICKYLSVAAQIATCNCRIDHGRNVIGRMVIIEIV